MARKDFRLKGKSGSRNFKDHDFGSAWLEEPRPTERFIKRVAKSRRANVGR